MDKAASATQAGDFSYGAHGPGRPVQWQGMDRFDLIMAQIAPAARADTTSAGLGSRAQGTRDIFARRKARGRGDRGKGRAASLRRRRAARAPAMTQAGGMGLILPRPSPANLSSQGHAGAITQHANRGMPAA